MFAALLERLNPMSNQSTLKIVLPHVFSRDTLYIMLKVVLSGLENGHRKVIFDCTNLNKIEVGGVTALSNVVELYRNANVNVTFQNAKTCGAAAFLEGSGFLAQYQNNEPRKVNIAGEFFCLKLIEYTRSHSYLNNELIPWLAKILQQDVRALATLKVCFEEIFNNIQDHSTVKMGCCCAHYDPTDKKIIICMSDFGVGIPAKVRSKIETASDQAAIAKACEHGFSTHSTPGNMGAGLHVLIQNVVTKNSGSVIIFSGNGIYSCVPGAKGSGRSAPHGGVYPGTMIYITIDTKKFVPSEIDKEAFVWE